MISGTFPNAASIAYRLGMSGFDANSLPINEIPCRHGPKCAEFAIQTIAKQRRILL